MFQGRRVAAFSLIEITVAMGILVVALLMAMSMVALSGRQQRDSTETALARAYLNTRAAELRALLHKEVLTSVTREGRYQETMDFIDTTPTAGVGTYTDTNVVLYERGPKATYTCVFYQVENKVEATIPGGGMDLSGIDIDANGIAGEAGTKDADVMRMLPVRLTLTWTPVTATLKDGTQDQTVELNVLLY